METTWWDFLLSLLFLFRKDWRERSNSKQHTATASVCNTKLSEKSSVYYFLIKHNVHKSQVPI